MEDVRASSCMATVKKINERRRWMFEDDTCWLNGTSLSHQITRSCWKLMPKLYWKTGRGADGISDFVLIWKYYQSIGVLPIASPSLHTLKMSIKDQEVSAPFIAVTGQRRDKTRRVNLDVFIVGVNEGWLGLYWFLLRESMVSKEAA